MGRRQVEESFSSIFLAFFGIIFNDFSKFCCDFHMLNLYRISKQILPPQKLVRKKFRKVLHYKNHFSMIYTKPRIFGPIPIINDGATQLGKKNCVEKATFRAPPEGGSSCKNNISTRAGGQCIRLLLY